MSLNCKSTGVQHLIHFKDIYLLKSVLYTSIFRFLILIVNFSASVFLARHLSLGERGIISGVMTGITVFSSIVSSLQIERILKHGSSIYQELKGKTHWFIMLGVLSSVWLEQRYDLNHQAFLLLLCNFILIYLNALFVNSIFKFQSIVVSNILYLGYSLLIFVSVIGMVVTKSLTVASYLLFANLVELLILSTSLLFHRFGKRKTNVSIAIPAMESSKVAWYAAFLESNSVALIIFCFALFASSKFIALLTLTLSLLSPYLLLLTIVTPFFLNTDFNVGVLFNRHRGISHSARNLTILLTYFVCTYTYFLFLSCNITKFLGEQYIQLQESSALICFVGVFLVADKIGMLLLRRVSEDLISLTINVVRYLSYVFLGVTSAKLTFSFDTILLGILITSIVTFSTNVLFLFIKNRRREPLSVAE